MFLLRSFCFCASAGTPRAMLSGVLRCPVFAPMPFIGLRCFAAFLSTLRSWTAFCAQSLLPAGRGPALPRIFRCRFYPMAEVLSLPPAPLPAFCLVPTGQLQCFRSLSGGSRLDCSQWSPLTVCPPPCPQNHVIFFTTPSAAFFPVLIPCLLYCWVSFRGTLESRLGHTHMRQSISSPAHSYRSSQIAVACGHLHDVTLAPVTLPLALRPPVIRQSCTYVALQSASLTVAFFSITPSFVLCH